VRLVLDTNVALSGLLWLGVPGRLIEAAQAGRIVIIATIPLLAELRGVIQREKFAQQLRARSVAIDDLLDGISSWSR
jgi:putative PIN family toxin of toxin-antitoxin system